VLISHVHADTVVGCTCTISPELISSAQQLGFVLPATLPTTGKAVLMLPGYLSASDRVDFKKLGDIDTKIERDKSADDLDFGLTALLAVAFLKSAQDVAEGVTVLSINGKLMWELTDGQRARLRERVKLAAADEAETKQQIDKVENEIKASPTTSTRRTTELKHLQNQLAAKQLKNKELSERDKALSRRDHLGVWEKIFLAIWKIIGSVLTLVVLSFMKLLPRLKQLTKKEFVGVFAVCSGDAKKFSPIFDRRLADVNPEQAFAGICATCTNGTVFLKDYCV
jgi:hypothetical protein